MSTVISPSDDCLENETEAGSLTANIDAIAPIEYNANTGALSIQEASLTTSGVVSLGSQSFKGIKTFNSAPSCSVVPSSATDLVNKSYVDNLAMGLSWQEPVKDFWDASTGLPAGAVSGDRLICSVGGNGWIKNYIYTYTTSWAGVLPSEGWACYLDVNNQMYVFNGSDWVMFSSTPDHDNLSNIHLAGTGITYGHVNDTTQTIYGTKTFNSILTSNDNVVTYGSLILSKSNNGGTGFTVQNEQIYVRNDRDVNQFNIPFSLDSTSSSTGALIIGGGLGVAKQLHTGDTLTLHNVSDASKYGIISTDAGGEIMLQSSGAEINTHATNNLHVLSVADSTNVATGAIMVEGGVAIKRGVHIGLQNVLHNIQDTTKTMTQSVDTSGIASISTSGGGIKFIDTTQSTSDSTGSLIIAGGLGIQKDLYVTGSAFFTGAPIYVDYGGAMSGTYTYYSTINSSSVGTGSVLFQGGLSIAKNVYTGGRVVITDTTGESGSGTGSLVTAGGAKVGGNMYVGGYLYQTDGSSLGATFAGTVVTGGLTQHFGVVRCQETSQATSTDTGSVIIYGGASVAKNFYVGGNLNVSGTINASFSIYTWILSDVKASGTGGGTFTSGANRTRVLNTISGDTSNTAVTLNTSTSQFSITTGRYRVSIKAPAYRVRNNVASLYNVTDATYVYGQATDCENIEGNETFAFVDTLITPAATKVYEVRHQCDTTYDTLGFGNFCGFVGISETYTTVVITKL